jgi:hypothetical protein
MTRPDKKKRKEAVHRWKAEQRVAARAKLPLPNDQMQALFDMLDVEFPKKGCNGTLRLTREWLKTQGLPVDSVVSWLNDNGGFCDCEALANSEGAWREAIRDVPEGT